MDVLRVRGKVDGLVAGATKAVFDGRFRFEDSNIRAGTPSHDCASCSIGMKVRVEGEWWGGGWARGV
jgi:hypothetical protein